MNLRKLVGIAGCAMALSPLMTWAALTPAWLFQQSDLAATIVTTDLQEKAALEKAGWLPDAEGTLQTESVAGSGPLHRLMRVKEQGTDRLLETDVSQLPNLKTGGFVDEGIVGHVAAADSAGHVAVIQFLKGDRRIWIAGDKLQARALKEGWQKQGVHFWLWPAAK